MSITIIIIIITAITSIMAFKNRSLFYKMDFSPYFVDERKEWYRFLSHALIHADWWHLIMNMFVFYFFGDITQNYFEYFKGSQGILYFILLYAGGIAFAVVPTFKKHRSNPNYHSVGASGAVSSVLFSSVIFSPSTELCLYGIEFLCWPGIVWAILYLVYSYSQAKKAADHINHEAHFWGAIYGVVFTFISVPQSIPRFIDQIFGLLPF